MYSCKVYIVVLAYIHIHGRVTIVWCVCVYVFRGGEGKAAGVYIYLMNILFSYM